MCMTKHVAAILSSPYHEGFITPSAERTRLSLISCSRRNTSVGFSTQISSNGKRSTLPASCLKGPNTFLNSDADTLESNYCDSLTFPKVFQSFVEEICEETDIAEVKVKIGEMEVHVKRNVDNAKPKVSPVTSAPVEAKRVIAPSPVPPKATGKVNPFTNTSYGKSIQLEALEASGITGYVSITSAMVGSFKGTRENEERPIVSEGDIIRKGGLVGYVVQSGRAIPVKSNVTGEVLSLLIQDGDAIGYGDPIVAVLPSLS